MTAQACEPFLSDPRFRLIVHERRLDWHGNINWVMEHVTHEFYCYWPQDDLATRDYLASLVRFADAHPDYACAFSDIQWFEQDQTRSICPSLTGAALERTRYVIRVHERRAFPWPDPKRCNAACWPSEAHAVPKRARGIRLAGEARARRHARPRRRASVLQAQARRVALAQMAPARTKLEARGLDRVRHRYAGGDDAAPVSRRATKAGLRSYWSACAVRGMRAFASTTRRPSRSNSRATSFVRPARAATSPRARTLRISASSIKHWGAGSRPRRCRLPTCALAELTETLAERGELTINFSQGEIGTRLLQDGWAMPESWATWSISDVANLRLPIPKDSRRWTVTFQCVAHASAQHRQTIDVDVDQCMDAAQWRFDTSDTVEKQLLLPRGGDAVVRFRCPDAISPQALGHSDDPRPLALALVSATIRSA